MFTGSAMLTNSLLLAINGKVSGGSYGIAFGSSTDAWSWGIGQFLTAGSGWESSDVKDPWLVWDGSQYVCFYSGYNGTAYQIGRATASAIQGPWTKYASNPVIAHGTTGDPDEVGAAGPTVSYNSNDSPAWKMWYAGHPSGWTTSNPIASICFADSSDGITWTKRGKVIAVGTAGSFDDFSVYMGCFYRIASNSWYVFVSGSHDPGTGLVSRSAYCTCTDPATSSTYSALSQLSNYTGNVTVGGLTWQSNSPRCIIRRGSEYMCFPTFWNPTVVTGQIEACSLVTSSDLTSWASPTSLMFSGYPWSVSDENPSVMVAP